MKAYAAILSARFRTLLQYRAAALAGLACQVFFGLVRVAIFGAFYALSTGPKPMNFAEVVTYIWLGQGLLRMIPMSVDGDVRAMINSGSVAYELTRPLDLYGLWYTRSVAGLTAPVLLRCLPLFLFAGIFMGMQPPASWEAALACAAATCCGMLLSAAMVTLMTITLLWTLAGDGIARLALITVWTFSGIIMPLPLFPDWMQPVLMILPFRGLMDTPFRLYMGHIPPGEALPFLLHQLAWTLALVALGRWMLSLGVRRLVVQGG
jgi:ABC-2 type transport system permease protein